jgi:ubiquinone/menaquinone biosynthesis C-methylase UbiE
MQHEYESVEIEHENAIADRYNRDYHQPPILRRHHEDFAQFVATHFHPGDRVLDLGCGPASMWDWWRHHLAGAGQLVGCDISPRMVEEARRLQPDGQFCVATMRELPFESSSFDLVIASSVLHHVPDAALPAALTEVSRVLGEHGMLVGREPVSVGRLADTPGWQSGAIMAFRHLVCRLTHTREYGEPVNGEHHHAYDPQQFIGMLSPILTPVQFRQRHPFSFYVGRSHHPLVVKFAMWMDERLEHRRGQEFYYAAAKNYTSAADVAALVKREVEQLPPDDQREFLALLQQAAVLLERELQGNGKERD